MPPAAREASSTVAVVLEGGKPFASEPSAPPPRSATPVALDAVRTAPRPPASRARRWLREVLGTSTEPRPLAPLRRPVRPRVWKLQRSAREAARSARHEPAGIEEFLQGRLIRYVLQSPVPRERLPLDLAIEPGGRVRAAPRAGEPLSSEWLFAYLRAQGEPALALELRRADAEVARADAGLADCRRRLTEAQRELEAAARAPSLGIAEGDVTVGLRRPPVPAPWSAAIAAVIALLVLAVAWLVAMPLLQGFGLGSRDLVAEARAAPGAVVLPVLLSLATSLALFVFAAAACGLARLVVDELSPRRRAIARLATGAAAVALAAGLAWALLGARPGGAAFFLLALSLAFAGPPLLAAARPLHAARAAALRAAFAWDEAHAAAVSRWTREAAAVDALAREHAALDATRATWAQRAAALRSRVAEVERLAADAADAEARELRRLCDEIVAALDADRREYARRHAAAQRAPDASSCGA
jgi:hypothetical protein